MSSEQRGLQLLHCAVRLDSDRFIKHLFFPFASGNAECRCIAGLHHVEAAEAGSDNGSSSCCGDGTLPGLCDGSAQPMAGHSLLPHFAGTAVCRKAQDPAGGVPAARQAVYRMQWDWSPPFGTFCLDSVVPKF